MMSADFLTLCDALAETCRCSICKGYLSCSPIRMLPDGKKICGRCAPQNPDVSTTRDSVLENILNSISFPCRFRKEGCTDRLLFGQVICHEIECNYRIASCFWCIWKGTALTLFDHFNKEHKNLLKEKAEIKLQLAENTDGIFIFQEGSTIFVIRYRYDCNNRNFKYGIAYNSYDNESNVAFKITIINGSSSVFSINLKQRNCPAFDANFDDIEKQMVLNLKKICELLNNPDSIVIVFNLIVTQVKSIAKKLDLPRCKKCCNYLIPPLFMLEDKHICYECGERDSPNTPSHNQELSQLLKQIDFPCHWRNCSFLGKFDVYKIHQASCKYHMHKCFLLNCEHDFTLSNAIDHYTSFHNAEYFVGNITQNISFSGECYCKYKHIMKNDVYILFEHELRKIDKPRNTIINHSWKLHSTNPESITASVLLEHQHCTRKPKPFQLRSGEFLAITLDNLPFCFKKNEDITVTITINDHRII